jgi:hypothetical protein
MARPAAISYMLIRSPRSPRNEDPDALEAARNAVKAFSASWQRLSDHESVGDLYVIAATLTTLHHHLELQQSRPEDAAPPPSSAALRQLLKSIQKAQGLLERLARASPIARLLDGCDVHQDICSIKQGLQQGVEGLAASSRSGGAAEGHAEGAATPPPAAPEAGSDGRVEGDADPDTGVSRSASGIAPTIFSSHQQQEGALSAAEAAGATAAAPAAPGRARLDSPCPLLQDAAARLAAWQLPEAPELAQVMQALQMRQQQEQEQEQGQPAGDDELGEQQQGPQGQDAGSLGRENQQAPRLSQEQMLQEQRLRQQLWAALDSLQMSLPELRSQLELADRTMGGRRSDLQLQVGGRRTERDVCLVDRRLDTQGRHCSIIATDPLCLHLLQALQLMQQLVEEQHALLQQLWRSPDSITLGELLHAGPGGQIFRAADEQGELVVKLLNYQLTGSDVTTTAGDGWPATGAAG